jgi:hypothetical protein
VNLFVGGSIPLGHLQTKGLHPVPWRASSMMGAVYGLIDERKEHVGSGELSDNTRVCSWEGSQPPKLTHGVRILTLVLRLVHSDHIWHHCIQRTGGTACILKLSPSQRNSTLFQRVISLDSRISGMLIRVVSG